MAGSQVSPLAIPILPHPKMTKKKMKPFRFNWAQFPGAVSGQETGPSSLEQSVAKRKFLSWTYINPKLHWPLAFLHK